MYGDIDYMVDKLDFTYDSSAFAGLPGYVNQLRTQNLHYIIILVGNECNFSTGPFYLETVASVRCQIIPCSKILKKVSNEKRLV